MGTDMVAFIEYDTSVYDLAMYGPTALSGGLTTPPPPFADRLVETYSVTEEEGLYTGSKDYVFFGAIAGVRNQTNIDPLFVPRGLPPNPSRPVKAHVEKWGGVGEFGMGWLTLAEINAALDHQRVNRKHLCFETETILFIMANLENRLGDDRVRLVFGFWG
ncbi:MAG TPA: hypothetical protein VHS28_04755 [Chloroflexota bacterium]|nr:hypothetical protein [Chloroflexota bacterium]